MMKNVSLILGLVIVCACTSIDRSFSDGMEVIPVKVDHPTKDPASFLEKIELVPLETNDSSLTSIGSKVVYDKEDNLFAIFSKSAVYTFTGEGRYIGNSKKRIGQGPQEYSFVVDMNYNPYLKGIDFLNPYGTVYTYSPAFEFISQRKFQPESVVNHLMALDADHDIFLPGEFSEVLFADRKTRQITPIPYEGTISGGNGLSSQNNLFHIGDDAYFVPSGLNYYLYRIDAKEKKLVPIIYLDFGKYEVKEEDLPGSAGGKRTDSDEMRRKLSEDVQVRRKFVKSNCVVPMLKLFSDEYVYVYFVKKNMGMGSHFIYNRKKRKGALLEEEAPFSMYPGFALADNVLFALCEPDWIERVTDRKLMSAEEIRKMEALKEDDNPVVVKYYLK